MAVHILENERLRASIADAGAELIGDLGSPIRGSVIHYKDLDLVPADYEGAHTFFHIILRIIARYSYCQ